MDQVFRKQVLRAAVRDRVFLKNICHDLVPTDFTEKSEQIVAEIALRFWEQHSEPVGGLLRSDAEFEARHRRLNENDRKALRILVDEIQGTAMELVPVKALEDRVKAIRRDTFFEHALEEIITAQEKGTLSTAVLEGVMERAQRDLADRMFQSTDYLAGLEQRILRRQMQAEEDKYPLLLIDPIDEKIRCIGRGHFAIFVGPYSSGKSMFLLHVALAYAMQGLKVLYFTLEDPLDIVENRMDSCMTGIPMSKLNQLPNRLRKRFDEMRQLVRGRIHIIDATDGGLTISKVEKVWEQERADGFTADSIIIDYDEELECEVKFTGEMARKRQFEEIYKRFRRLNKKLDTIGWTAAQTKANTSKKRVITGDDIGEDYSKAKKAFLAIGIGQDQDVANMKFLYVMRHRLDRSRFGVEVITDFESGIAYDAESTRAMARKPKQADKV
jgi:hypothetical protein